MDSTTRIEDDREVDLSVIDSTKVENGQDSSSIGWF